MSFEWKPATCPLTTPWTGSVDPNLPLPEYPRPQLVRDTWINLNGIYDFAITAADSPKPSHFDRRILVPFPVESALSGIAARVTARQRLWYRRILQAPAAPDGHTWLLHFGAADWRTEAWIDGRALGIHEGGFDPFSFDAGALGEQHELVVAVWDPTDDGPQPRGKQALHAPRLLQPVFYTPASGIWQTVWLELVPQQRIERIRPETHGNILTLHCDTTGCDPKDEFRVTVSAEGTTVAEANGDVGEPLSIKISDARRWSSADPFLYDLEITLVSAGVAIDRVTSYCGFREIAIRRDERGILRFHLNGQPVLPHGLLDQGYWPDGIFTAPTDEALRFDIEETKRLGFNLIRKHVKVEPARWYWHCDRLGMLVFQDMPNGDRSTPGIPLGGVGSFDASRWLGAKGIRRTPESAAIYRRELAAMIATLGHHPSILLWVPFNEGWGQFDAKRIAAEVHELDPTRLVDAASGWVDPGNGDVRDVHIYFQGPRMPARRDPSRAEVLGEWGGLGLECVGHRWPRRAFAYRTFATREELAASYARKFARLQTLIQHGLAAAVLTQTTDVEGEINGLLTYDRRVWKIDPDLIRVWNRATLAAADDPTAAQKE